MSSVTDFGFLTFSMTFNGLQLQWTSFKTGILTQENHFGAVELKMSVSIKPVLTPIKNAFTVMATTDTGDIQASLYVMRQR